MSDRRIALASESETRKLKEIIDLGRGGERPDIEFKQDLVLDSKKQRAELAKDVALQANLPNGGDVVFGVSDKGIVVGSTYPGSEETIASILTNRLYYAPPGIRITEAMVPNEQSALVRVIWLKVPRTPFAVPCSYLDVDGIPKMPIRVGTVTKHLTPLEAVEHYRGRLGQPIHPEEVSRNVLARNPVVLKETIETNMLEITRPPTTIATSKTDATTEAVLFERNGAPPFPLRLWNGNVVSLRSKEELARYCGPDSETASESADEFIKDLGGRRVVLGLLNLELLSRADSLGFMVDWEKQRVFFRRRGDVPVKHSWQSFSRRANRTVVGFVPGPEGIPRYWYHFGAYLKTKYIAGHFFVTLSPTWVFTKDGTNLIDRERSQSLSASKLNRERNDRVLYNLHLWYQLLSENKEFIDLPLAHGQGRVEALPVTCSMDRGIEDDSIQTSELELDMDSELPGEEKDSKEDDELDDVQDGLP